MINYELSFLIAQFAFVYACILTQPHQIFEKPYMRLYRFFIEEKRGPVWIFKIIVYCEKCVAGQMALWIFLFTESYHNLFDVLRHLFFITLTILITTAIGIIYNKATKD